MFPLGGLRRKGRENFSVSGIIKRAFRVIVRAANLFTEKVFGEVGNDSRK